MNKAKKKTSGADQPRIGESFPTRALHARPRPRDDSTGPDVAGMVESIIGCKWSLHVIAQVRKGINRPGALVRSTPGLTGKVLAERLDKMIRFGIFRKVSYPEVPPRVEYFLTPFGVRFIALIDAVDALKRDVSSGKVSGVD